MVSARLSVAVVLLWVAAVAAPAEGRQWRIAYTGEASGSFPRYFTVDSLGRTVLWATGRRSVSAAFSQGIRTPEISVLAGVDDLFGPTAVSRAGVMLRVASSDERGFSAILDAPPRPPVRVTQRAVAPERIWAGPVVAVGPDGTAIVVWSTRRGLTTSGHGLYVMTRPAAGGFGAPERLPETEQVPLVAGGVRSDGTAEIAYVRAGTDDQVMHAERPAGGTFSTPRVVAAGGASAGRVLEILPAETGPTRIVYDGVDDVLYSVRTLAAGWSEPQRMSPGGDPIWSARLAALPDGDAVLVWDGGYRDSINLHRAGPSGRFGRRHVLVRERSGWKLGPPSLAVDARGGAAVGWVESLGEDRRSGYGPTTDSCPGSCDGRALVTVVSPAGEIEPASVVSPLGSNIHGDFAAVGLDDTGRPAAAWRESADSTLAPGRLLTAFGAATAPQRPEGDRDHRAPRVTARATLAGARAASRGRTMPVRVRCNERCVVRAALEGVTPDDDAIWPPDLGFVRVVLGRNATSTLRLRTPPRLRPRLRRRLLDDTIRLRVIATDRAGNAEGRSFALRGP
jgi:hypothetical protein